MAVLFHLCAYLRKHFSLPVKAITEHHRLAQDLGLSPVEVTEVVVYLELLYEASLPDEQISPSLTTGRLFALIGQYSPKERNAVVFLMNNRRTLAHQQH